MKLRHALLAVSIAAMASPAFAATQGTPGPTSTGTVTINASITPEVAISDLDDFTFTATELTTALNTSRPAAKSDQICVWSNNVDRSFYVTATGDGAGGAFTLTDGTRTLPYTAQLATSSQRATLAAGTKGGFFTADADRPDCSDLPALTTRLFIILLPADIAAMESTTTYTGVLTLLVTPS